MKKDLDGRSTALVTGNGGLVNREVLFIFSNRKTGLLGYHWIDYRWSFNPNSMSLNSKYNRRPVKHIHDLLLLFFLIIMSNLVFVLFCFFSLSHMEEVSLYHFIHQLRYQIFSVLNPCWDLSVNIMS